MPKSPPASRQCFRSKNDTCRAPAAANADPSPRRKPGRWQMMASSAEPAQGRELLNAKPTAPALGLIGPRSSKDSSRQQSLDRAYDRQELTAVTVRCPRTRPLSAAKDSAGGPTKTAVTGRTKPEQAVHATDVTLFACYTILFPKLTAYLDCSI